ncbi:MAG: hypothetical protein ACI8Z7_000250 [Candidatus Nanohaloarchaea archaeon]|jgi:hypothetical protein
MSPIDELEPYKGGKLQPGSDPRNALEEVYDDLIPAIVNCIGSWDYETGEPEWGKFKNKVANIRVSKIDGEVNQRHLSNSMEYLRDRDYIGVMEQTDSGHLKYDFSESNIYDLAELHRFLEKEESSS